MPPDGGREIVPSLDSGHSRAEDHSAHLITKAFDFSRIGGVPEPLSKVEEFLLLSFLSLDPGLDKFQQYPVRAQPARLCQFAYFGSDIGRQRNHFGAAWCLRFA